jgi:hypothetical protein
VVDTVTSQTILDGARNVVMAFTNISDGTGEANVVKVDPALLSAGSILFSAPAQVAVRRIKFSTKGMGVIIRWQGTPSMPLFVIAPDKTDEVHFMHFGGLVSPPGLLAGTGRITFTTVDAGATSSYSIVLEMRKKYEIATV